VSFLLIVCWLVSDGSHCVLWEDWISFLCFMGGYIPLGATIKRWIKQEKVQDGYDILREIDGLTLVNSSSCHVIIKLYPVWYGMVCAPIGCESRWVIYVITVNISPTQ
jgi:hypothetical protein